jgi:hypothetical protein
MVDPVVSKTAVKPLDSATDQGAAGPSKVGESKFDKVRTRLQEEQAGQVQIPPEVKQVSLEQKKILEADLSKRLQQTKPASAHELFSVDMKRAKEGVEQLTNRVNALPKTPAFDPLRKRLASIDSQYQSAGRLVNSVQGTESPAELMKVQMKVYQLTENLELMSKVVEQVTSGMKTLLQTQV